MKLIVGVILSLALLELFHCAPLIGGEEGKNTKTASSWGYHGAVDGAIGVELGYKDGHGTAGMKTHGGIEVGGFVDPNHAVAAAPQPSNFGSGFGYPFVMPNNPANRSPYYTQNVPQPPPQYRQFAPQSAPEWPQYDQQLIPQFVPQYLPQYAYAPQYVPQNDPQYAPQYYPQVAPQYRPQYAYAPRYAPQNYPQYAPQYFPQGAPQYTRQGAPQYTRQGAPQYSPQDASQDAPHNAQPKEAPESSQRTINEVNLQ